MTFDQTETVRLKAGWTLSKRTIGLVVANLLQVQLCSGPHQARCYLFWIGARNIPRD